jgi:hypothetical protein
VAEPCLSARPRGADLPPRDERSANAGRLKSVAEDGASEQRQPFEPFSKIYRSDRASTFAIMRPPRRQTPIYARPWAAGRPTVTVLMARCSSVLSERNGCSN